jgi:hypothetical protein
VANLTQFPDSEIEVAVSPDAQNIVIGTNNRYHFSNDGGQTFAISTLGLGGPNFTGSDPSVGYGESGAFYAANIRGSCQPADVAGPFGYTCTGIWISTDDGQTFALQGDAVVCPNSDPNGVVAVPNRCFPDQEHIVADRFNAAAGGDQVYSTWRNFDATDQDAALVCSQDSGATWTAPLDVALNTAFPRIGIGQDGFVYVAYLTAATYEINKFSSCATGLVEQPGFPRTVANIIPVVCPFAGHDRCDQNPSSQMVAVDDTNPSHVYYSYAENTGAGNEDIIVRDSLDGGFTWPGNSATVTRVVRANTAVASQRIMPWICTTGGDAYVTWYDRRGATPCPTPPCAADNDLTDFYAGQVGLAIDGNLEALGDFRISDVPDSWCDSGWPCGTRQAPSASEACSNQPQLAGICRDAAGNLTGRCDFSDCGGVDSNTGPPCQCPAGDICRGGGGCPKYGDYNGNACAAGRLFASWASATSPPSISPPSTNIDTFLSVALVGDVPLIQVPGDLTFAETCVGSTSSQTLEVCNTGNSNLEVFPTIVSSDAQFSVTAPSGGYPVIISPDFCFPFEVQFTPAGSGQQTSTLTLTTNDPANETVEVTATGSGGEPDIATAIADAGSFGEVCRGDLKDLDLTISNRGACELTVTGISSNSPDFLAPGVMSPPLVIAPGNAVAVPIRFAPTSLGAKNGTITILSDDPDTPSKAVSVSGSVPPGDVRLTGSGDFGDVCAEAPEEKTISVCNVGPCDLAVSAATVDCADFTIVNSPFPATVSPDSCLDLVVAFTPTDAGPKACKLTVLSDDPDTPAAMLDLTANTPLASIDVPPDQGFRPTVIQSVDVCELPQPFPVSNTGRCNLDITDLSISTNPAEYSLSGLPSFPIILEPGAVAGSGDLRTVFAPEVVDRDELGNVSVTYVHDPITGDTTTVERNLCGEGVRTGARVLVTQGGVPLDTVKSIRLNRINANRNRDRLDTHDNARNVALQMVTPASPCAPFQYHREYGTVSNPIQLLPGSYEVTVQTRIDGRMRKRTVGFDVNSCGFNPTIIVDF